MQVPHHKHKVNLSKEKFPIQKTGDSEKIHICDTRGTTVTSQNSLQIGRYTAAVKNTSVRTQRKTAATIHKKTKEQLSQKKKYTCPCGSQKETKWNHSQQQQQMVAEWSISCSDCFIHSKGYNNTLQRRLERP